MLKTLVDKIAQDKEYLGWYFYKYMEIEKKSFPELINQLNVGQNEFYKAALCKAPSGLKADFTIRLKRIADFAGINIFPLVQIIRSVDNSISFNDAETIEASLMAAREKDLPHDATNDEVKQN